MSAALAQAEGLLAPVPGATPFGVDARYEPEHEAVRDEIKKLQNAALGTPNWQLVLLDGGRLLQNKSKDWLIACYVAGALFEAHGVPGAIAGMSLINGLARAFWDDMFPAVQKQRPRSDALQWFIDFVAERLHTVARRDDELAALRAAIGECEGWTKLQLAAAPPSFTQLRAALGGGDGDGTAPLETTVAAAPTLTFRDLAQAWLHPISDAAPCGTDLRQGDEAHERLCQEIKQSDSPHGHTPNWFMVLNDGGELLEGRSKDLQIAAYVAEALRQARGLVGLVTGIGLIEGLLRLYADGLFPARAPSDRKRGAALEWWMQRLLAAPTPQVVETDRALVEQLVMAVSALSDVVSEQIEQKWRPALRPLVDYAARVQAALPALQPPPSEAPGPRASEPVESVTLPPAVGSVSTAELTAPVNVDDADAVNSYLRRVRETLGEIAAGLRHKQPSAVRAYHLTRVVIHLWVQTAPVVKEKGRTGVKIPLSKQRFETMLSEKRYAELLEESEKGLDSAPLWLDLQHYSFCALDSLGPEFAAARDCVAAETVSFLVKFPSLPSLLAEDGRPLASPECKRWLATLSNATSAVPASAEAPAVAPVTVTSDTAIELLRTGQVDRGVAAFQASIDAAAPGRGQFLLRLALAEVLMPIDPAMSAGLFGALCSEIERRQIEAWEPPLAARCYAGYYQCLGALTDRDPELRHVRDATYRRLCGVDLVRASALRQGTSNGAQH